MGHLSAADSDNPGKVMGHLLAASPDEVMSLLKADPNEVISMV